MNNLAVFDGDSQYRLVASPDGLELYIYRQTGEAFASQRMLARLVEKGESTIRAWKGAQKIQTYEAQTPTPQGVQSAQLFSEDAIYQAFAKWKPELLIQCAKAGLRLFLHGLVGYRYMPESQSTLEDRQALIQAQQRIIDLQTQIMDLTSFLQKPQIKPPKAKTFKRSHVDFSPYASRVAEYLDGKDAVTADEVLCSLDLE